MKNNSTQRQSYKVKNWPKYNKSLINRGDINLWFKGNLQDLWYDKTDASEQGRPPKYSNTCIQVCLTVKVLYRMTYRQLQGFFTSFFRRLGVSLEVPSYTQLSRRSASVPVPFKRLPRKGKVDIAIDSTGLKVFGEGEWKVRMHGVSKRRVWKKLHLMIDPLDNEVLGACLTPNNVNDHEVFEDMIDKVEDPIDRIFGDGAYNTSNCYQASYEREIELIVPPPKNAVQQKNETVPWLTPRDQAIERIKKLSKKMCVEEARSDWKHEKDYHQRSLAETAMYRFKTLFGNKLWSRREKSQQTESMLKVNLMNQFTKLGMPESMPVVCL